MADTGFAKFLHRTSRARASANDGAPFRLFGFAPAAVAARPIAMPWRRGAAVRYFPAHLLGVSEWCFGLAAAAGLLQAWAERFSIEPDGVNYLDISYAYLRHDWNNAINAYWSPLYSWLLAAVFALTHTSLYWEATVLHAVNFGIYLFALACFGFFFRELTALVAERASAADEQSPQGWAWTVLGYSLFTYSSLELVGLGTDRPDMFVSAIFLLATASLIRIRRGQTSWRTCASLGAVLAIGYLAKAVLFPLTFVFLVCGWLAFGNWRRAAPRVALALVIFLAIGGPWVIAISRATGRITYGDAGRVSYAWFVNGLASLPQWHGEIPGAGTPIHGMRRLNDVPPVDEFATPVAGTYPPWYDPSYWLEGLRPHFELRGQLREIAVSGAEYFRLLSAERAIGVGALVLALLAGGARGYFRELHLLWTLWLPALATCGLYALVHVEPRFLGAPMVILWCFLFAAVRLPRAENSARVWNCVALAVALTMGVTIASQAAGNALTALKVSENTEWGVSADLMQIGLRPGDAVAVLGHSTLGDYWAHLAQVRIVADVPAESVRAYWESSRETKSRISIALRSTGARFLVTRFEPPASESKNWVRLGVTGYYALPLAAKAPQEKVFALKR
jgi:hypothetical protein